MVSFWQGNHVSLLLPGSHSINVLLATSAWKYGLPLHLLRTWMHRHFRLRYWFWKSDSWFDHQGQDLGQWHAVWLKLNLLEQERILSLRNEAVKRNLNFNNQSSFVHFYFFNHFFLEKLVLVLKNMKQKIGRIRSRVTWSNSGAEGLPPCIFTSMIALFRRTGEPWSKASTFSAVDMIPGNGAIVLNKPVFSSISNQS